jgi:hypothetical protein
MQSKSRLKAVASLENLFLAATRARRGKSRRPDVAEWWQHRAQHLAGLQQELLDGSWQPKPYRFFEIHEPKRRVIAAAPFEDRVVHHALYNLMAPLLERRFIARSFSCQVGKGTTAARECCRQLTNRYRHVLKCDVSKFFPNIDHEILFGKLAELIHCAGVLEVIRRLLASYRIGADTPAPLFPGDDLLAATARPRGLPIGNLTSQLWGNFYLDELDHWITETQRHGDYLRYTDDFLLFGDDKARLWELRTVVREQLAGVRLKLAEPKSRLLATREGVPFCGFRFLPELRPRILGGTKRRFERRRYQLFRSSRRKEAHAILSEGNWSLLTSAATGFAARRVPDFRTLTQAVFAWYQFSREGNSEGLRREYRRWPLVARLKRRRRKTNRVLRGASWNNNDADNLLSSNRNRNTPGNRNDNNGFRCVLVMSSSPKAERFCPMAGGDILPAQCQASSLTVVPVPAVEREKTRRRPWPVSRRAG